MMARDDDNTLIIRRRIRATREELFAQWTDPESMRLWMCPGNIVSSEVHMDLRVGGSLLIIMRDLDKSYEHQGEFTVIEAPAKLAFTWIAAATELRPTLVTVEFNVINESETELVLTHEKLPGRHVTDQYRGGWGKIVALLDQHLQNKP